MSQDDDLEEFTRKLQAEILEQIKKRYTPTVIDHWQNPRNLGRLESPDGYAQVKGSCGDTMEMFLRVESDLITDCTFQTDGCGTTIACGSVATELAQGKSFPEALGLISAKEILKRLGGLPESDVHCANLAAETLRRALADYLYQKSNPWRKYYRKT
ncbi:MAG: iron-sulfur cluster assembly scaffold protein [Candidatus Aminicenantales bacterium]